MLPTSNTRYRIRKIGDLRIEDWRDEELYRYVRAAKLFPIDASRCLVSLPKLLDGAS